jgi:hypothetical protein
VNSLEALDSAYAFHTSGRFELLASEHVPFVKLGATDADGALLEAIVSDEAWYASSAYLVPVRAA